MKGWPWENLIHQLQTQFYFIDYDREMALVAEHIDPGTGMHDIIGVGRDEKLHRIVAYILFENHVMQRICEKLSFCFHRTPGGPLVRAEIQLH